MPNIAPGLGSMGTRTPHGQPWELWGDRQTFTGKELWGDRQTFTGKGCMTYLSVNPTAPGFPA